MRLTLGLAACLMLWTACRSGDPQSLDEALNVRAARLVSMALANGQAYQILEDLCAVAPHRLAGSQGAERAVEWGYHTMRRLGLQNVRREAIMVPHWVRGDVEELVLVRAAGARGSDGTSGTNGITEKFKITALGGSIGTPAAGLTGEVVMVRSFEQLTHLGDEARGKMVFFNRPMNPALLNTFAA